MSTEVFQPYPPAGMRCVYWVGAIGTDRVKIGFTRSPKERLMAIQTTCPYPLEVLGVMPGTRKLEAALHELFRGRRKFGEWFEFCVNDYIIADAIFCQHRWICEHYFGRVGAVLADRMHGVFRSKTSKAASIASSQVAGPKTTRPHLNLPENHLAAEVN